MSVRFVIGRAGSGKTARGFRAIVEAMRSQPLGPPIYWLVPKQATFQAERELTCGSGLGGFCRARVVSFDQLGRLLAEECGGSSIPEVTPSGRQMILGHLLRQLQPRLRFFTSVARQPGLAAELDATFAELERSGKSAADLSAMTAELEDANPVDEQRSALLGKLRDLRLLYDAYETYLGQERLDPHRRLTQVLASLAGCGSLRQSIFHVDGFTEFSDFECRLLAGIAKAGATVEIALTIDPASPTVHDPNVLPHELSLFHRTEETYRRLWFAFHEQDVPIQDSVLLKETSRFEQAELQQIERELFSDPISPHASSGAVQMIEAPDRQAEVDAAARGIRSLMIEGVRLRDIVVLVRQLDPYQALIDASFREHGIPYFVDRRRTAAHHPLLQFLRSVVRIARHDWPHDAVMTLLKSGLAGLSLYDADAVENYVLLHRLRGGEAWEAPGPWRYRRQITLPEEAGAEPSSRPFDVDGARRTLVEQLLPLLAILRSDQARSVREFAGEVFALFDRLGARAALARWISESEQSLEQRGEHAQVWANLVTLFEQMVSLLGDETVTPADFVDILESGLEQFDLALTPPTVDQVLVGPVDRTRTGRVRAAFVLGLNEGEFPASLHETSVLSDRERHELRRRKMDLDPDLRRRSFDENFLGYVAFTRASERLVVSRPVAEEGGKPTEPSSFWRRFRELLPKAPSVALASAGSADPSLIGTPRQLITSLMQRVRRGPAKEWEPAWRALYHWFSTDAPASAIEPLRQSAWPALSYANTAALSRESAQRLFPAPLRASVSQVETFAACAFRHFLRYGMQLQSREKPTVTAQDLGRLYHQMLDKLLGDVLQPTGDEPAKKIDAETVYACAAELGKELRGELMLSSARNQYLLDRVGRTVLQFFAAQRALMQRGSFRPKKAGLIFADGGDLQPLRVKTPGGAEAMLHGKIDRLDLTPDGAFAVMDYRLASGPLSLVEAYHGISLQLLAYLLVLQDHGEALAGRPILPAAAFYLQLLRGIYDVLHPSEGLEPTDPRFHLRVKPRGILDAGSLERLDKELAPGWSAGFHFYVSKDGSLGFRGKSDVAEPAEFQALLRRVRGKLGELAEQILAGRIDIAPYRLNRESPCPRCEFRGVCRFELSVNRYNHLVSFDREGVFAQITKDGAHVG